MLRRKPKHYSRIYTPWRISVDSCESTPPRAYPAAWKNKPREKSEREKDNIVQQIKLDWSDRDYVCDDALLDERGDLVLLKKINK